MKKSFLKRAFAFILCVAMLLSVNTFSLVATAEEGDNDGKGPDLTGLTLQNGGTIDTIKWYLYDNGLLYITGTGTIPSDGAWNSCANSISSLYVDDGITNISAGAFQKLQNVEEITLPFVGYSSSSVGKAGHFGYIFGIVATRSSSDYYCNLSENNKSYMYGTDHSYGFRGAIYDRNNVEVEHGLSNVDKTNETYYETSKCYKKESHVDSLIYLYKDSPRMSATQRFEMKYKVLGYTDKNYYFEYPYLSEYNDYVSGDDYGRYFLTTYYYSIPSSLKKVVITNDTDVAPFSFSNCFFIESIELKDEITSIGERTFAGCTNLKEIYLSSQLTTLGFCSFYECSSLQKVNIPSGVSTIPAYCFMNCVSLESVNCEKVKTVSDSAFDHCELLRNIYFGKDLSTISSNVFSFCSALKTVHYAGTATDWTNISVGSGVPTIHYNTAYVPQTEDHEAGYYCDQCGEVIAEHLYHQFDGGTISAEPTHLTDGIRSCTCTVCGITKTETIDKLTEHIYGDWQPHSDTQHKKVCECGDTVYDVHHWNSGVITTQPTHTEFGVKTFTCLDCGATRTEDVAKLTAHTYGEWTEYSSTHHQKVCACGAALYEVHHWASEITKQASHLEVGTLTYTCTDCGAKKSEDIPKLTGHSYGAWLPYTQTQHKKVCECGDTVYANHNWNAGVIVTAPTYTSEGQKKYTCTDCGEVRYETISKLTVTANTPTLSISEATALQGDTVSVTINLGNNPGFIGLNLQLTYSDKLTLISATNQVSALTFSYGKVFIWDGGEDYKGNDALLTLIFKVDETAAFGDYEIGLTVLEAFNNADEDVAFYTVNGKIEVIDFIYGDVNGDKVINTRDIVLLRKYVADKDIVTGESDVEVSFGADVNADGEINTRDIVLLRKYVAGIDPATGISDVEIGPKK